MLEKTGTLSRDVFFVNSGSKVLATKQWVLLTSTAQCIRQNPLHQSEYYIIIQSIYPIVYGYCGRFQFHTTIHINNKSIAMVRPKMYQSIDKTKATKYIQLCFHLPISNAISLYVKGLFRCLLCTHPSVCGKKQLHME